MAGTERETTIEARRRRTGQQSSGPFEETRGSDRVDEPQRKQRAAHERAFIAYVQEWIERYGTAEKLADAIGMSPSGFSRGVKNEGTLSTENCLRFAEETGEAPGKVLRLAGKSDVAERLERLYGHVKVEHLSGQQREVIDLWRRISDEARASCLTIIRHLATLKRTIGSTAGRQRDH